MGAYLRPRRLEEALTALARPHAVLAGGTDFYPARVGRAIGEDVLDIGAIAALRGIAADGSGCRSGDSSPACAGPPWRRANWPSPSMCRGRATRPAAPS